MTQMTLDEYFAQFTDQELVERGWNEIRLLCGSKDKPKRWTMTIPVDPKRDSDVLFGEILNRLASAIEQIEEARAGYIRAYNSGVFDLMEGLLAHERHNDT